MKATINYVQERFDHYNRHIFGSMLPPVPIELSKARTFLGKCVYKRRRSLFGKVQCYDFRLRINALVDLSEDQLDDIILHEMIHYCIGYRQLHDTSAHGRLFRQMMNDINARFARHITISHRYTDAERAQLTDTRQRQHWVAVVAFSNGRTGIKVLSGNVARIVDYYYKVKAAKGVESVEVYTTDNPFFNRYPHSCALRAHYLDADTIRRELATATRAEVSSEGLTVRS